MWAVTFTIKVQCWENQHLHSWVGISRIGSLCPDFTVYYINEVQNPRRKLDEFMPTRSCTSVAQGGNVILVAATQIYRSVL